jgi:hypothetical protein
MRSRSSLAALIFALVTLVPHSVLAGDYSDEEQQTIDVVDRQIQAYNNQDIAAFAATYHEDVEIHHFPADCNTKGNKS